MACRQSPKGIDDTATYANTGVQSRYSPNVVDPLLLRNYTQLTQLNRITGGMGIAMPRVRYPAGHVDEVKCRS